MGQTRPHSRSRAIGSQTSHLEIPKIRVRRYADLAVCCGIWRTHLSSRSRTGSVVQDKRSKSWFFYSWVGGKRRCKTIGRFPSKTAAWKAAKPLRDALEVKPQPQTTSSVPTVGTLVE